MGAHHSKKKPRNLAALERNSSKKKYLINNATATAGSAANGSGPCNGHDGTKSGTGSGSGAAIEDKAAQELPPFTDHQKELVASTWKVVQEDISRVGVNLFMKLFETHPEVQSVFMPFKGKSQEDLQDNDQLKNHALRVMHTVEKCLTHINEPERLLKMLQDLGIRHVMYNAKVDYMDLIGPQFIWAIEPVLGDQWTHEVEQAWSDLFKFISHIMKEAMRF